MTEQNVNQEKYLDDSEHPAEQAETEKGWERLWYSCLGPNVPTVTDHSVLQLVLMWQ